MVDWGREDVMNHLLNENIALTLVNVGRDADAHNYFVTKHSTDKSISSLLDNANVFPPLSLSRNQPIVKCRVFGFVYRVDWNSFLGCSNSGN